MFPELISETGGLRIGNVELPRIEMAELEREHVHSVYSQIAPHFSDTRFKPWPRIAQFLKEQATGSLVADVGCGNGKYLGVNPHLYIIGSDICPELVSIARTRGHEVAISDCLNLPYRTGVFDAAICIAVVHHLSTEERRLAALKELARIVRTGGRILVYVWAMEQERKKFARQDVLVPWHLQPKYSGQLTPALKSKRADSAKVAARKAKKVEKWKRRSAEKSERSDATNLRDSCSVTEVTREERNEASGWCPLGELQDLFDEKVSDTREEEEEHKQQNRGSHMPFSVRGAAEHKHLAEPFQDASSSDGWSSGGNEAAAASATNNLGAQGYKTFQRYYHVFCSSELTKLFSQVEGVGVLEEFYDHENWCVLVEKQEIILL